MRRGPGSVRGAPAEQVFPAHLAVGVAEQDVGEAGLQHVHRQEGRLRHDLREGVTQRQQRPPASASVSPPPPERGAGPRPLPSSAGCSLPGWLMCPNSRLKYLHLNCFAAGRALPEYQSPPPPTPLGQPSLSPGVSELDSAAPDPRRAGQGLSTRSRLRSWGWSSPGRAGDQQRHGAGMWPPPRRTPRPAPGTPTAHLGPPAAHPGERRGSAVTHQLHEQGDGVAVPGSQLVRLLAQLQEADGGQLRDGS